jgi:hypothetical protein
MKVKTTYLEMLACPERVVPPPREGLAVVHAKQPTVGDKACGYRPRRFWLHTCTEGRPAPNYLKAGFALSPSPGDPPAALPARRRFFEDALV